MAYFLQGNVPLRFLLNTKILVYVLKGSSCINEVNDWVFSIPHLTIHPCLSDEPTSNDFEETCEQSLQRLGEDPFYLEQFPGGVESTGKIFKRFFVSVLLIFFK